MAIDTRNPRTRRALLVGGIGGLAALVASALGRPLSANAGSDGDVVLGATNTATTTTRIQNSDTGSDVLSGESGQDGTGVFGFSAFGVGVKGEATWEAGVFGTCVQGPGVKGESGTDRGVVGITTGSTGWAGVYGKSESGQGVEGVSVSGTGVLGTGGPTGVHGEGSTSGVHGHSAGGVGVKGDSESSAGVSGTSDSGVGVSGSSNDGIGIHGAAGSPGKPAIFGQGPDGGTGVFGAAVSLEGRLPASRPGTGVFGYAAWPGGDCGVAGQSTEGRGVAGIATTGQGVLGTSTIGTGVMGFSGTVSPPAAFGKTGIYGYAAEDTTSVGVVGQSTVGRGVTGLATSGVGVRSAVSTGTALWATASTGGAVVANSTSGTAITAHTGGLKAGTALRTIGRVRFDNSIGIATIPTGSSSVTVTPGIDLTATSAVVATLQGSAGGTTTVHRCVVDATTDQFTIYLTAKAAVAAKVAWHVFG